MIRIARRLLLTGLCLIAAAAAAAQGIPKLDYRVLATTRTSTLEKEMNAAADAGYRFAAAMGGETAVGGKEAVAVMSKTDGPRDDQYKLLATNRTSTMEKELQMAAEAGYEYRAQTVFESAFGGREVVCILERNADKRPTSTASYRLLATTRTSTMEKELHQSGLDGYAVLGLTVGKTAMGGTELVAILRRAGS